MFECMEFAETIDEGVVEPSYLKILEQMLTVMVTTGKREENRPRQKFTSRWVNTLASAMKCM